MRTLLAELSSTAARESGLVVCTLRPSSVSTATPCTRNIRKKSGCPQRNIPVVITLSMRRLNPLLPSIYGMLFCDTAAYSTPGRWRSRSTISSRWRMSASASSSAR